MKKILAVLLVMAMLVVMFAACETKTSGDESSQTPPSSAAESKKDDGAKDDGGDSGDAGIINMADLVPVVNEPVNLTLAITVGTSGDDPNDMPWFQWMSDETGLTFDFVVIDSAAWAEKKPIMLATDDLPDVFLGQDFTQAEIMKYGYAGSFLPLNDLIDTYGDQIISSLALVPGAAESIVCPDGNIYSLPALVVFSPFTNFRPWINQSWLDAVGLENPETLDEFYNVLVAFKNEDPNGNGEADEIPWSGSWKDIQQRAIALIGCGFITMGNKADNIALTKDDEATYMPLHENYRKYLEFMAKCYAEGLIDQDIFSQDEVQFYAKAHENSIGACVAPAPFYLTDSYENWNAMYPLVENKGEEKIAPISQQITQGKYIVTKACENPDVAIRFANLFYTPWYSASIMYGPLDANGVVVSDYYPDNFADIYVEDKVIHIVNSDWDPDEMGLWDYYAKFGPVNSAFSFALDDCYALNCIWTDWDPLTDANPQDDHWRKAQLANIVPYTKTVFPAVFLSEEQLAKVDELKTPLETLVEQWEARFITGAASIDADYDTFISELKAAGAEEYQQIYVDAYNTYKAH